jgi:hypothetical protein
MAFRPRRYANAARIRIWVPSMLAGVRQTSAHNGTACGYQELFAALAIPNTTGQAGGEPYIYTLLHLIQTPASAAFGTGK